MEEGWRNLGRLLMILGGMLVVGGALLYWLAGRGWSWPRLPGDIVIQRPGFSIYLPLGTSLLLSLVLSLLLWICRRFGQGGGF